MHRVPFFSVVLGMICSSLGVPLSMVITLPFLSIYVLMVVNELLLNNNFQVFVSTNCCFFPSSAFAPSLVIYLPAFFLLIMKIIPTFFRKLYHISAWIFFRKLYHISAWILQIMKIIPTFFRTLFTFFWLLCFLSRKFMFLCLFF